MLVLDCEAQFPRMGYIKMKCMHSITKLQMKVDVFQGGLRDLLESHFQSTSFNMEIALYCYK